MRCRVICLVLHLAHSSYAGREPSRYEPVHGFVGFSCRNLRQDERLLRKTLCEKRVSLALLRIIPKLLEAGMPQARRSFLCLDLIAHEIKARRFTPADFSCC